MSLQELKAHIIETVSNSDDEEELRLIAEFADDIHESRTAPPQPTEEEIADILEGRAEVVRGEYCTMEELDKAMLQAAEEGLRRYKAEHGNG